MELRSIKNAPRSNAAPLKSVIGVLQNQLFLLFGMQNTKRRNLENRHPSHTFDGFLVAQRRFKNKSFFRFGTMGAYGFRKVKFTPLPREKHTFLMKVCFYLTF